ncbi:MAG: hypothetical protein AAEJ04_03085 [Planctomycetota bacterium]
MNNVMAGCIGGIVTVGLIWSALVVFEVSVGPDSPKDIASAQSAKKVNWRYTEAGTVPTEFGELIQVNGTSGNYTLVFQDTEKVIRLVDLRGGKIPQRAISIQRKY